MIIRLLHRRCLPQPCPERSRFGWWAPWKVTAPWGFRFWKGTDEWHNPAYSIKLPFLGAFHWWVTSRRDDTPGHFDPREHPGCLGCRDILAADEV